MTILVILLMVAALAFANGANDNFKGVATLLGSGTTSYRGALAWATVTTLAGSLTAVFLAGVLLKTFSGRGLVDAALVVDPAFVAAVASGSALTILLATWIGMPVSTTHSLVGALVGVGWAAGSAINLAKLAADFFGPLLLSPVVAILATGLLYVAFQAIRRVSGVRAQSCFCIGSEVVETVPALGHALMLERAEQLTIRHGDTVTCQRHYEGRLLGIDAGRVVDWLHFLSAGIVSFARGLNDTPKIAALLLLVPLIGRFGSTALVGGLIAIGGLLGARKVAVVMSQRITAMNHGQGFTANLVTGLVVIGASRFGMPVSTTHVSCGALFGIGVVNGRAEWGTIGKILLAWITTLPAGAALGGAVYFVMA